MPPISIDVASKVCRRVNQLFSVLQIRNPRMSSVVLEWDASRGGWVGGYVCCRFVSVGCCFVLHVPLLHAFT